MDQFRDSMLEEPDPGPNYAKLMEELGLAIYSLERLKDDLEVVQKAYYYFNIFKGLIVDLIFSFKDRNDSRNFFLRINAGDALKVIEVELNFMYEVLYTKAIVVHSKRGYVIHLFSFTLVLVALVLFRFHVKKDKFLRTDVKLTYVLLLGSICIDTIAFFRAIFSDWAVADLEKSEKQPDSCWKSYLKSWIGISKEKVLVLLGLKDFVDGIFHVSSKKFTDELWKVIFDDLQKKSVMADDPEDAKTICSARATDLLYHDSSDQKHDVAKERSKLLSDYMMYLLIMQPTMMAAVAGIGKIRFRDTCAEAERFLKRRVLGSNKEQDACKIILDVNTEVPPVDVKGDRSKSVLFDASKLAKLLQGKEKKWELLSKVWVELLSYAAGHCRAYAHAQHVSKGGELITFVWLLMAHLGLADQFQINKGHARAKLIVGK
ncbi:hypothetical protein OIU84_004419 [Salix udensis]|uniref:DUF4220 domain-containing protein n=1 Tax=Salix udensis TaxID=889485 RepID=A0AAD6P3Q2_9ROSI|nr:hypothetical protein OIU84_004419 [Salix udensis]